MAVEQSATFKTLARPNASEEIVREGVRLANQAIYDVNKKCPFWMVAWARP
jgi:hypothetical protein